MTTFSIPLSPIVLAARWALSISMTLIPDSISASIRLGSMVCTFSRKVSLRVDAGAGLSITFLPYLLAIAAAYSAVSIGTSSCMSIISASFDFSSALLISSSEEGRLAPGATIILFSPKESTEISATPDGLFLVGEDKLCVNLFRFIYFNACNPNRSYPILEMKVTSAPSRAAAIA